MNAWQISRPQVNELLAALLKRFPVFAPVPRGSQFVFGLITKPEEAVLDYDTTILPPRKFLLPPREKLFNYPIAGDEELVTALPEQTPRVVCGVHSYDLHGLDVLRRIFAGSELPDPYFAAHDARTFWIGIDHTDDDYKFTRDMRTNSLECTYDLFLINDNDGFILLAERHGLELLQGFEKALPSLTAEETIDKLHEREAFYRKSPLKLTASLEEWPAIFPAVQESAVWQQEAEKCFSCGSCNTTCPTCYCFDIRDLPAIGLSGGERQRIWDSCMLEVFARVATGENFRGEAHQRLKHRFNRKIWYHRDRYARAACIGCGRCSRACKAEINIINVLNRLKEEYNDACSISAAAK
jgi:sulfhydrogenase subunit beta (sulfur reductase)